MLSIHACRLLFNISTCKLPMHMQVPAQAAGFPAALLKSRIRRIAVCDYITRAFGSVIASAGADMTADMAVMSALHIFPPHRAVPYLSPRPEYQLDPHNWWVQGAMCGSRAAAGAARRAVR
jgi:hypothetical protein